MDIKPLLEYLNTYLNVADFKDYCPNGLQVTGRKSIKKIVTGVTACQALLDVAVAKNADAILVHHGYFWKGENPCVTGRKQQHLKTLLSHDINLLAYHLPLDAHPQVGNNVQLAKRLDFEVERGINNNLLWFGQLEQATTARVLAEKIATVLGRQPQVIAADDKLITSIAWCTGAAQDYIEDAVALNVDAYLSGEISERTYHQAVEYDVAYFAAGHHATEMFGIEALGQHLQAQFDLDVEFVNIPNPV